jgi:hypothetical protein
MAAVPQSPPAPQVAVGAADDDDDDDNKEGRTEAWLLLWLRSIYASDATK